MANFVEFEYLNAESVTIKVSINKDSVYFMTFPAYGEHDKLFLIEIEQYNGYRTLRFKTKEEAQAVYDLLRGKKEDKFIYNNIDVCQDCGNLIKGLNFCTKCSVLGKIREEASKREPSIKDPDSIPITIGPGKFININIPRKLNIKEAMEFYEEWTKPFQDKLDRIRDLMKLSLLSAQLLGMQMSTDDESLNGKVREILPYIYDFLYKIKAILNEGEE